MKTIGKVIEKIIVSVKEASSPDLEVTIKGSDLDMLDLGARIVSALRKRHIYPDVQMVPVDEIKKATENL